MAYRMRDYDDLPYVRDHEIVDAHGWFVARDTGTCFQIWETWNNTRGDIILDYQVMLESECPAPGNMPNRQGNFLAYAQGAFQRAYRRINQTGRPF